MRGCASVYAQPTDTRPEKAFAGHITDKSCKPGGVATVDTVIAIHIVHTAITRRVVDVYVGGCA